ncbi:hypothetical protein G6M89_02570 [Natronolimnobius sp. AArcel1]|uniref:hypothetical protein n=1 Tax=Natronolimnobius sp. AArcel1 TaxID=1679093 RepID=UPI0013EB9B3F|nr:hypothetical protein [Natronolimnobius sp. AArcel1]NGM67905.1 hypothetical protein [Natronolimnobius sp. AArcel1]
MERRQVLTALGGTAVTLSIAGCLDDSDTGSTPNDSDTGQSGTDDESTDDETGGESAELIESSDRTLGEAADEFEEALDEADDPMSESYAIETAPINARIDDAESDLEDARDGATDNQLETIHALEDTADFFRDFVGAISAVSDAFDEFEVWEQYLDQGRWDDAVDAAAQASAYNDEAKDSVTVAQSTFDDIDTAALEDVDEIDRVELETDLKEIDETLAVLDVFFTGCEQLTKAMIPLESGADALEREDFTTASDEFSSAAGKFDIAYTTFNDAEDDAPAAFRADLIDLSCQMEAFSDAADYYSRGADAYASGNFAEGDEHFEAGETAESRCENDDVAFGLR